MKGTKRVRPPRRGPAEAGTFEDSWKPLEKCFTELHEQKPPSLGFEALYRAVYKLILTKQGDRLYSQICEFEQTWLTNICRAQLLDKLEEPLSILTNVAGDTTTSASTEKQAAGEKLLRDVKTSWEDYQRYLTMVSDLTIYLDRVHCIPHHRPTVSVMAKSLFTNTILRTPLPTSSRCLVDIFVDFVLCQIQTHREEGHINWQLLNECVPILESLHLSDRELEEETLYLSMLEARLLATSTAYYRQKRANLLQLDSSAYCRQAKMLIAQEQDLCWYILQTKTEAKVHALIETDLLPYKTKDLLEKNGRIQYMYDTNMFEELGLIFDLQTQDDPQRTDLTKAMQDIITREGEKMNLAASMASSASMLSTMVEKHTDDQSQDSVILKWFDDYRLLNKWLEYVCKTCFISDEAITDSLMRTFSQTMAAFDYSGEYKMIWIQGRVWDRVDNDAKAEIDTLLPPL